MAGITARRGEGRRTVELLRKALASGWADAALLDDPEFDTLRGDPAFEDVLAEVRKRLAGP